MKDSLPWSRSTAIRLMPKAAGLIRPSTGANPYNTVELLQSLRRDGLLVPADGGWRWDQSTLRGRLERVDVTGLLVTRAARLPPASRQVVRVMACLAGRVELDLLEAATGLAADEVERRLAPACDAGLLVLESDGRSSARFHHDRARESVLGALRPRVLRAERLRLARRLAGRDGYVAVAAEQYLPVLDAVSEPAERRLIAQLLRRAADDARLVSDYQLVERYLTAAVALLDPADVEEIGRASCRERV